MGRVKLDEILVVAGRLFEALLLEVDVRDLELGEGRVVAVGVVVDDLLEELDGPRVVDVREEEQDPSPLQGLEPAPVVTLCGRNLVLGRRARAGEAECQEGSHEKPERWGPGSRATSRFAQPFS
jgi:hypothetical protein